MTRKLKLILVQLLFVVMTVCSVLAVAACASPAEPPEIRIKSLIPKGTVGVAYDFTQCFYADEGVDYSIVAKYSQKTETGYEDVSVPVDGLSFTQNVFADVYVTLIAERGGARAESHEIIVPIQRAGDEDGDILNVSELICLTMPGVGEVVQVPFDKTTVDYSANSYRSVLFNYPETGKEVDAEVRLEVRVWRSWHTLDLSEATLQLDIKPVNRSNRAVFKFESTTNTFGNFVEVELGAGKRGTGWTCDEVSGREGWYHVEIECAEADIDRYQTDKEGVVGEAGEDVRIFGVDDIWRVRVEVPFEGEEGTASKLYLDNLKLPGGKATDLVDKSKYTSVFNALNKGIVMDGAVSGGYSGVLTIDKTDTCNSDTAWKLTQGLEPTTGTVLLYPALWINLVSLSDDGLSALDLSSSTLEFDYKVVEGTYTVSFDFLDIPNNISKTTSLWPGNPPVVAPWDGLNASGVTVEPIDGKTDWFHVKIVFADSDINTGAFSIDSVGYMRIICNQAAPRTEGEHLVSVDNIIVKFGVAKPKYVTEHYLETGYKSGEYTLRQSVRTEGDLGEAVTAEELSFAGYTFDESNENNKLGADFTLGTVLKVYYKKDAVSEVPVDAISGATGGVKSMETDGSVKLAQGESQTTYPGYWIDLRTLSADGKSESDLTFAALEFEYKVTPDVYTLNIDFMDIPNNASKPSAIWLANHSIIDSWGDSYNFTGVTVSAVEGKDGWYKFKIVFRESGINSGGFGFDAVAFLRITCSLSAVKDVGTDFCFLKGVKLTFEEPSNSYTVNYYCETAYGSGEYELTETKVFYADAGQTVNAAIRDFAGFMHDPDHADSLLTGVVTDDNGLTLAVYYAMCPWYVGATEATNTGVVASDGDVVILKQGDANVSYPGSIVNLKKASADGTSALDFSAGGTISFDIEFLNTYALNIDLYDSNGALFTIQIWLNTDMSALVVNTAEGFVSAGVTAVRNGEWVHVEIDMAQTLAALTAEFAGDSVASMRLTNSESAIPAVGTELYRLKNVVVSEE